jgi:uncharacterized protein (TIGR03067 family)
MTSLHGTWLPIRAELDGEAAPDLALQRMELVLQPDAYMVRFAGTVHDSGTFLQTASTLILTAQQGANTGRVIPAIYQLAGDRLRICYGIDGIAPTGFATQSGSQRYLVTYRRQTAVQAAT